MAADFLKPPNASPSNFVVDASGKLTLLKVPVGNAVTVHLTGYDNRGNNLTVREDGGTRLVNVWSDFKPRANATSTHVVTGSVVGNGKLVALGFDLSTHYAELPFEVGALQGSHDWSVGQPAPQAMWFCIHGNFHRVRWLGISMPPGHEDHSEGRAVDLGLLATVPWEATLAGDIIGLLIAHVQEIGWSYFIWNRQIWTSDPPINPTPYTGKSAHTEHIHISWSRVNSQRRTFPNFVQAIMALRSSMIVRDGSEV